MSGGPVAAAILAELPAEARAGAEADVAQRVTDGLAAIHARWPDAPAPDAAFCAHLAGHVRGQPDLPGSLARLRLDDLFLAWWAASGDTRGIAAFEAAHAEDLRRLLARFHRLDADELTQQLRIKLFSTTSTQRPRLLEYSGFGFLQNWYRVIASRTFLDAARSTSRERTDELPDALLADLVDPKDDPGLRAQKAQVLEALKRALGDAIGTLAPRDRTFLRHVLVDGLTVEQIAKTYELHRVTVSKALGAARKLMHDAARSRVLAELNIDAEQLASAIRVLDSKLDLSLPRLFRDD